jgi:alpha-ketoglutarate-dependent taurine dioxygenase
MRDLAAAVRRESIAIVNDFPSEPEALVEFGRRLGEPMIRRGTSPTQSSAYIGDVRFRPDIGTEQRLPTQTSAPLPLHTARSFEKSRPRYFLLLMVDPGWPATGDASGGESLFVRWQDVVEEFRSTFSATAEADLARLASTPIAYKPWYVKDEPAVEPLVSVVDYSARYWENMLGTLDAAEILSTDRAAFRESLERFDSVAQSCGGMIQTRLCAHQLAVLDNRKMAHGRAGFLASRCDSDGEIEHNPRRIWTVHVL